MNSHYQKVSQVVENIESNLAGELNIAVLANELGLSSWHFQRLFKSIVGDSLGGYLRGRRLTKGAELLLETEFDIIQIASAVGFNSHEAFTRSFKKYFKMVPKDFREERPQVLLNKKPHLNKDLQDFIFNGIERDPLIVDRSALHLSGYTTEIASPFFASETMCQDIFQVWQKLINEGGIPTPRDYAGVTLSSSGDYIEEKVTFLASEVLNSSQCKDGRIHIELPGQKVAMFKISIDLNEDNLGKTIDYIYGLWLPNSKFNRGSGHDYEYFKGVTKFENFSEYEYFYVLPLEAKK